MEPTEQTQLPEAPLHEQLKAWLKDHNVAIVVQVRAPRGEMVSTDNFVPPGWLAVVGLQPAQ